MRMAKPLSVTMTIGKSDGILVIRPTKTPQMLLSSVNQVVTSWCQLIVPSLLAPQSDVYCPAFNATGAFFTITHRRIPRIELSPVSSWHPAVLVLSCVTQVNRTLASAVCWETGTSPRLFFLFFFTVVWKHLDLRCDLDFSAYFNSQAFSHSLALAALVDSV